LGKEVYAVAIEQAEEPLACQPAPTMTRGAQSTRDRIWTLASVSISITTRRCRPRDLIAVCGAAPSGQRDLF